MHHSVGMYSSSSCLPFVQLTGQQRLSAIHTCIEPTQFLPGQIYVLANLRRSLS
jgi:hypothetical protein